MKHSSTANFDTISLRGARQHNLQGIDIDFLLGKLTVICGVSGSGKTSLALDTLYAEGQRRYIESFSAYTRQFLQRIDKPKFDSLTNLPPSIANTRQQMGRNNRSTVGTASELLEYLRIVFAKHAKLRCCQCNRQVVSHTPKTVLETLRNVPSNRAIIGFEIQWQDKNDLSEQLFDLQSNGLIRLIAGQSTVHLADNSREDLAKQFQSQGTAIVVVDRVRIGHDTLESDRVTQSLATAFEHSDVGGNHSAIVLIETIEEDAAHSETLKVDGASFSAYRFSEELRCEHCQLDYPESEPRLFNFNSPIGACERCEGFGETVSIDMTKVIPDRSLSIRQGAIAPWKTPAYQHEYEELLALAGEHGIPLDAPVSQLSPKHWKIIQGGDAKRDFGGLDGFFAWLERKKYKMHIRAFLSRWRTYSECEQCRGRRLNAKSLSYQVDGTTFSDLCELTIDELTQWLAFLSKEPAASTGYDLPDSPNFIMANEQKSQYVASEPLQQAIARTRYLQNVGLGYVSLARPMHTLSSGEAQRVSMTTLLGSNLVDMLYVFDEPTVGLHPQDTEKIADAILDIRARGNTVILVEHEPYLMKIADQIIEIGPGAGELGGTVTFQGTPDSLLASSTNTAQYLNGNKGNSRSSRAYEFGHIELRGACGRNLKQIDISIPLGCLNVVIGPSGAGKSTLILDTLCPAISKYLGQDAPLPLPFDALLGVEKVQGCVAIDQSPIPRSARSCPATISKAMDDIRTVFAGTTDAKARSLNASHFSFNSDLGRCPTCEGLGYTTVEMQFMADIQLPCTDCDGRRFRNEVLEVRYRDLNISEVLQLGVEKAHSFFRGCDGVQKKLKPLIDLGLGYLPLGQNLTALSAGESMRLKLASHLDENFRTSKRSSQNSNRNLIVLDEPTAGLHFSDIDRLIQSLNILVDQGHTVLIIEHNQQIIRAADYILELGPGAGPVGGRVIAEGPLEAIRANTNSVTAKYL